MVYQYTVFQIYPLNLVIEPKRTEACNLTIWQPSKCNGIKKEVLQRLNIQFVSGFTKRGNTWLFAFHSRTTDEKRDVVVHTRKPYEKPNRDLKLQLAIDL